MKAMMKGMMKGGAIQVETTTTRRLFAVVCQMSKSSAFEVLPLVVQPPP